MKQQIRQFKAFMRNFNMKNKQDLPYQGIGSKELTTLYNQSELGLSGFEKILNIYTHLKKIEEEFEKNIETSIKESLRKCLEQVGEDLDMVDDLYKKVESLLFTFPVYKGLDFTEWCITTFEKIEILKTKFIDEGVPTFQYTCAEDIAYALDDFRAPIFIRVRTDRIRLEIFMEYIIKRGYPDKLDIDDHEIRRQKEEEKKRQDKIPGKHDHRSNDIINKYKELTSKFPDKNQSEILQCIEEWYLDLTKKTIDESTIRHHLKKIQ